MIGRRGAGRNPAGSDRKRRSGWSWRSRAGRCALAALTLAPGALVLLAAPGSPLLLAAVVAGVLLATLGLHLQGRSWRDLGVRRPRSGRRLAGSVLVGLAALIALTRLLRPRIRDLTGEAADLSAFQGLEGDPAALAAALAVVWTVAAFGEELLFRGFLLNTFREIAPRALHDRTAWAAALAATSVLAALGHAYQGPTGMVVIGILALGFGIVYLAAGSNLWAAILTHGLYDTIGFVMLYLGIGSGGGAS